MNRFAKLNMENDSYVLHYMNDQINLTLRHNGKMFHCPINKKEDGNIEKCFLSEFDQFDSIPEMISFYQRKRYQLTDTSTKS